MAATWLGCGKCIEINYNPGRWGPLWSVQDEHDDQLPQDWLIGALNQPLTWANSYSYSRVMIHGLDAPEMRFRPFWALLVILVSWNDNCWTSASNWPCKASIVLPGVKLNPNEVPVVQFGSWFGAIYPHSCVYPAHNQGLLLQNNLSE